MAAAVLFEPTLLAPVQAGALQVDSATITATNNGSIAIASASYAAQQLLLECQQALPVTKFPDEPPQSVVTCVEDPCSVFDTCEAFPLAACTSCFVPECPCCAIFHQNDTVVDCTATATGEDDLHSVPVPVPDVDAYVSVPTPIMVPIPFSASTTQNDSACVEYAELCDFSLYHICPDNSVLYPDPHNNCEIPACASCTEVQCCLAGEDPVIPPSTCECLYQADTAESLCYPFEGSSCAVPDVVSFKCFCVDLALLNFGDCQTPLGSGIVDGECVDITGCSLPSNVVLYDSVEECQSLCAASIGTCAGDLKDCGCGLQLRREPRLDCDFAPCPFQSTTCSPVEQCDCDISDVDFGMCGELLGYNAVDGVCQPVEGCSAVFNSYVTLELFQTLEECKEECQWSPCDAACPYEEQVCKEESCPRFPNATCTACADVCSPIFLDVSALEVVDSTLCACGCGDMNDDGQQDILDIIVLLWYILDGVPVETACGLEEGDLVEDGVIDVLDAVQLTLMILSGWTLCDGNPEAPAPAPESGTNVFTCEFNGFEDECELGKDYCKAFVFFGPQNGVPSSSCAPYPDPCASPEDQSCACFEASDLVDDTCICNDEAFGPEVVCVIVLP